MSARAPQARIGQRPIAQSATRNVLVNWRGSNLCCGNGEQMIFSRITIDPSQMAGVPCIRGLRIPVATIVGMLADGMTHAEILRAFPDLEPDDLSEALRYAAEEELEDLLDLNVAHLRADEPARPVEDVLAELRK